MFLAGEKRNHAVVIAPAGKAKAKAKSAAKSEPQGADGFQTQKEKTRSFEQTITIF